MLTCGCCGEYFYPWPEYVDQDQDAGFGICQGCQDDAGERVIDTESEAIALVAAALNKENAAYFNACPREKQLDFCHLLMVKGILQWHIKSGETY